MELEKPKALLFDWDNTLVDTWPIIHRALHDTMSEYNMTPWTMQEVKDKVARSMRDAFPELFGDQWEEAGERYMANYRKYNIEWLKPLPGSLEMLEAIQKLPVFRGIVSNKRNDNLRAEVEHLGWGTYFDVLVGSGDAARDKPFADPVHKALEKTQLKPDAAIWFIGDSHIDLETAEGLGMTAIFYYNELVEDNRYKGFPFHHRVADHQELMALFSELKQG